jgi:hypothetical protein
MERYILGVVVFGLLPVLYCLYYYMSDVVSYVKLEKNVDIEDTQIKLWQVSAAPLCRCVDGCLMRISSCPIFRICHMACCGMDLLS